MSLAPELSRPVSPAGATDVTASMVRERLKAVHREAVRQRALVDTGRALLLVVLLVAGLALVDYFWVMAFPWRAAGGLLAGAAVTLFVIRAARNRAAYSEAHVAEAIERLYPQYGQRIRTSRDYGDPAARPMPAAPGMVALLEQDTQHQTGDDTFRQLISPRPVLAAAGACSAALILCLAFLVAWPELWISLGRTLLLPLRYTSVTVTPVDGPIPAGEDVRIVAEVNGRPVREADLLYRPAGSEATWSRLPLLPVPVPNGAEDASEQSQGANEPAADGGLASDLSDSPSSDAMHSDAMHSDAMHSDAAYSGVRGQGESEQEALEPIRLVGTLHATLLDCQEDLEYKVVAGPHGSPTWRFQVLQPLTMEEFAAHIESPSYTGVAAESTESMDLKVIEGSGVQWEMAMSRSPSRAQLVPLDEDGKQQMAQAAEVEIVDDVLRGGWQNLQQSMTCLVLAETDDGMTFESPRLRIRVQPDARPKIRFVEPPEDLEVIPTTEVTLAVEADDDFGVRRLGIACKIADGPMETMWVEEMPADAPKDIQLRPVLFLEDFELTHQDAVTYYAFAEDNYPGGSRRTTTELRFIDIRPFKREYQILPASGGT